MGELGTSREVQGDPSSFLASHGDSSSAHARRQLPGQAPTETVVVSLAHILILYLTQLGFCLGVALIFRRWKQTQQARAPDFSLVSHEFPGSQSQSALSGVRVRESGLLPSAGGYSLPAPKFGGSLPFAFIFRYLWAFSWLPALYLKTELWRCSFERSRCIFLHLRLNP